MFSLLEKAKGAVRDAAGKVKEQANTMAKLLNARVQISGAGSYLVDPEQFVLPVSHTSAAAVFAMKLPVEKAEMVCSGQADLGAMAVHLNSRFGAEYLVINLSDAPYDYTSFRGKVSEFFFPGYPAPPVKVIVQMCVAIDAWLASQRKAHEMRMEYALPAAVDGAAHRGGSAALDSHAASAAAGSKESQPPAVLFHCQTGKGRTAVAIACYLAWAGVCPSPMEALDRVCAALAMPVEMATIPSQRRYVTRRFTPTLCRTPRPNCGGMVFEQPPKFSAQLERATRRASRWVRGCVGVLTLFCVVPCFSTPGTLNTSPTSWTAPSRRRGR
jgi:hypothetical protein